MTRGFVAATLVIAGVAAIIEAHIHRPIAAKERIVGRCVVVRHHTICGVQPTQARGLSPAAFDLLRIGGWVLVIVGALLIVAGLLADVRRPSAAA